jgi:hypothetical protein
MAKTKRRRSPTRERVGARMMSRAETAAAAVDTGVPEITVPAGGVLEVIVDVGPMTIPYTVAYAGRTVVKGFVDRAEPVPLKPGTQFLSWAFAHAGKGWTHKIAVSIDGGPARVLEERSEANRDPDHSVGFAVVNA